MRGRARGFTLVELAIVLVIIGIILGAVLKGQELIFNAKVKRLQSQVRELIAAYYTYYDKYGRYPGDNDNNGTIDNSEDAIRALRNSNILTGDPTNGTLTHVFGGSIQFFGNSTGNYLYLINVPKDAAEALDRNMDDGKCNSGTVFGNDTCTGSNYNDPSNVVVKL